MGFLLFCSSFCFPGSCIHSTQSFSFDRKGLQGKKRKERRIHYHMYFILTSFISFILVFTVSCFLFFTLFKGVITQYIIIQASYTYHTKSVVIYIVGFARLCLPWT
ncbi:hypothetical protein B9Z19DRAFT_1073209 [Tuber borchii]|uniref:Uncharacterized protein n=1 Tax=Tuber borchii TaxID=42251 RepID=A0A2T7A645_TUBBO|nr:hypothetical protein B9Z19DRAFT_1073209 [Tuber borchii]